MPAFAGGGADLDWEDGIPHREGAWTFTTTGTTDRAPLPGLDEAERTRHKGDLVYPNLMLSASADHVAAFVLHPRAVDRTEVVCSLLFDRDEAALDRLRPQRRRRAVGPGQPAGLGDLRVGAARHVVAGYRHGWFAPMEDDSLDIRRWLLPAAGGPPMSERVDYVVAGLGALGSAAAMELARRGHRVLGLERFELGHSRGASHDTSRILRHSYHTPAYVRLTQEAYADWARLERDTGSELVTTVGGLDLFPPDAAIAPVDYTTSLDEVGIDYDVLDARRRCSRAGRSCGCPTGTIALHQADAAIVPAGRGTRTMQDAGPAATARSCASDAR